MAREPNKHRSSVGHDGRSKAFAKPGERTLAIHHDPNVARRGDKPDATAHLMGHRGHPTGAVVGGRTVRTPGALDIQPRAGAPKAMHPVSIHNGMHSRQIAGAGVGGMGHPGAVVDGGQVTTSAAAAPMADHFGGALPKTTASPQASWGMRDRSDDAPHGGSPFKSAAGRQAHADAKHAAGTEIGRQVLKEALRSK
jgi:hypothetical protein